MKFYVDFSLDSAGTIQLHIRLLFVGYRSEPGRKEGRKEGRKDAPKEGTFISCICFLFVHALLPTEIFVNIIYLLLS